MPASDSPAVIVARFLQANHYDETLDAFLKEAGLPQDAGNTQKGDITIEKILEEKKAFDLSVSFEKLGKEDSRNEWTLPAPSIPRQVTLPTSANLLHVSLHSFKDDGSNKFPRQLLLATTSDRRLNFIDVENDFSIFKSLTHIQDSPILSCLLLASQAEDFVTITSGMSGQVVVYDHNSDQVIEERRDHTKYVVKIAHCSQSGHTWIATAGWDSKVYIYHLETPTAGLGAPIASLTLPTNPETIAFIKHPESAASHILLLTRRDSTSLYFYQLPASPTPSSPPPALELLGSQNLAPHSNSWVAFSPSSVAVCPTDPTLVAIATSTVPHMKLLIARLLLPPLLTTPSHASEQTRPLSTNAQARTATLSVQDREDAAILVHVSTLAPQTPYSTPQVVWRPDGSGVWVNGDDGVVRGLAAATGKVETVLRGGHEGGSKVRSLWCGRVDVVGREGGEEWVVSGGFDRRLVVWRPGSGGGVGAGE